MKTAKKLHGQNTVKKHRPQNRHLRPPWKKGVSGNPGGRPHKLPLTEALQRIVQNPKEADKLARGITREGKNGSVKAFKEIADRVEGKVRTHIEVTGPGGEDIKAIIDHKLNVGDLVGAIRAVYGLNAQGPTSDVPVPGKVDNGPVPPKDSEKK